MRLSILLTTTAVAAAVIGGSALASAPAMAATADTAPAASVSAAKPGALFFPGLLVNQETKLADAVGMNAEPGATVTVGYDGKTYTTVAGDNGFWAVNDIQVTSGKTTWVAFQTVDGVRSDVATYVYAG